MKRAGIALMFVAVLGLATSAVSADTSIWFTSGGAGADGTTLVIEKPAGPGRFEFTITAMANTTQLAGYSVDLFRDPGDLSVTIKGWMPLVPAWELTDAPGLAGGDTVFDGGGQAALFAAPIAGINPLFSITLSVNKAAATPGAVHNIFAGIGFNLFAPAQQVTFGPNAPISGSDAAAVGALPVISIVNIPEPATLALLGLGVVGLIRRRR